MDRRAWLIGSGLCVLGRAAFGAPSAPSVAVMAREGGVLLIRHTSTEPGVGDPPGFTLGQCSSQRNLSEVGRSGAIGIGALVQSARVADSMTMMSRKQAQINSPGGRNAL